MVFYPLLDKSKYGRQLYYININVSAVRAVTKQQPSLLSPRICLFYRYSIIYIYIYICRHVIFFIAHVIFFSRFIHLFVRYIRRLEFYETSERACIDLIREKNILKRKEEEEKKREKKRNSLYCAYVSLANVRERTSYILFFSFELSSIRPCVRSREGEREKVNYKCIYTLHIEYGL
jgi:hypothetical protein